jgi:hypothetical protein
MTLRKTVAAAQLMLTFLSLILAITSYLSRRFGLASQFTTCGVAAREWRLTSLTVTFTSY